LSLAAISMTFKFASTRASFFLSRPYFACHIASFMLTGNL
jgi:hypothetical protein